MQLPHPRTIEKELGKANSETGHSRMLLERIREWAKLLSSQDRESMALLFDEINAVGDLAFKILNGEYVFYRLAHQCNQRPRLFCLPHPTL